MVLTGWNLKIQARETNYGTRIDYILATQGLMKWIKHGDIQASLKGSDHCPVFIDLHDEITLESGEVVTLRDAMQQDVQRPPPRIAAVNWDEFSGKQTLLSSFFGKKSEVKSLPNKPQSASQTKFEERSKSAQTSHEPSASQPAAGSKV